MALEQAQQSMVECYTPPHPRCMLEGPGTHDRVMIYVTADQVLVVVRHEAKEGMGHNDNTPDDELDDKFDDRLDEELDNIDDEA